MVPWQKLGILLSITFLFLENTRAADEGLLERYATGCDYITEVPVKGRQCAQITTYSIHEISIENNFLNLKIVREESGCLDQRFEEQLRVPRSGVKVVMDDAAFAKTKTIALRCEEGLSCVSGTVAHEGVQERVKRYGYTFGACNASVQDKMQRLLRALLKQ